MAPGLEVANQPVVNKAQNDGQYFYFYAVYTFTFLAWDRL